VPNLSAERQLFAISSWTLSTLNVARR